MQSNLTRIEDLAGELRRQLGPLARQAATARRAQVIGPMSSTPVPGSSPTTSPRRRRACKRKRSMRRSSRRRRRSWPSAWRPPFVKWASSGGRRRRQPTDSCAHTENWQRLGSSRRERFRGMASLATERQRSLLQPGPAAHRGESLKAHS